MQEQPTERTDSKFAQRAGLIVAGAVLFVAAIIVWTYATTTMTSWVENSWCTILKAETCQFRGYQHFLIWTVLGIVNAFVLGLLFDRVDRARR